MMLCVCVCVCAGGGDPVAVDTRPSLQTLGQGSAPVPPPATQDGGRTVGGSPLKNHAGLNISAENSIFCGGFSLLNVTNVAIRED